MNDDRNASGGGIALQLLQHFEPGSAGHHQIENDEFRTLKAGALSRLEGVRLNEPVACSAKHMAAHITGCFLVIHDQNHNILSPSLPSGGESGGLWRRGPDWKSQNKCGAHTELARDLECAAEKTGQLSGERESKSGTFYASLN